MEKSFRTKRNITEITRYCNCILGYLDIETNYIPSIQEFILSNGSEKLVINVIGDKRYIHNEINKFISKYIHSEDYQPFPFSYKTIALAITAEVLEHYGISFDLIQILKEFEISLDEFDKMSDRVRQWAKKNYWTDSIDYYV